MDVLCIAQECSVDSRHFLPLLGWGQEPGRPVSSMIQETPLFIKPHLLRLRDVGVLCLFFSFKHKSTLNPP